MKIIQINFDFLSPEIRIEGADFWSCNGLHVLSEAYGLKPTGWFQVHRPEDLKKERYEHKAWLFQEHDFPIWVNPWSVGKVGLGPAAVALPMEQLNALWTWPFEVGYGSTFSYQIALAILQGYELIDIRDVKLSDAREKTVEAPNFLLWVGEAHKRGIQVLLSPEFAYPFKYGQVERLADLPGWIPANVVTDMFPGWSFETRALFDTYKRNARELEIRKMERYNEALARRTTPIRNPVMDAS